MLRRGGRPVGDGSHKNLLKKAGKLEKLPGNLKGGNEPVEGHHSRRLGRKGQLSLDLAGTSNLADQIRGTRVPWVRQGKRLVFQRLKPNEKVRPKLPLKRKKGSSLAFPNYQEGGCPEKTWSICVKTLVREEEERQGLLAVSIP